MTFLKWLILEQQNLGHNSISHGMGMTNLTTMVSLQRNIE